MNPLWENGMTETRDAARTLDREQAWRAIMTRWQRSGLSQQAFCEKEQIKLSTFGYWRRELKRRDGQAAPAIAWDEQPAGQTTGSPGKTPAPLFVPVEIDESLSASACEIVLGDGLVIRFSSPCDPGHMAQVVKTLEAR
jgi:hypothetical protein